MNNRKLHIALVLILAGSISLHAQNSPQSNIDTSYFKQGKDAENLISAVNNNSFAATELLLKRGVNPNTISSVGNTPMMYAAEKGNLDIMELLISFGAKVNVTGFNEETPLLLAILHNDFEATKFLLENEADPNTKDSYGVTPLMYAAATNQYQTADLLLFYEADKDLRDPDKNDPLLVAVSFDNLETSDVLLQNGLDVNVQDKDLNTPAIVATQHGNHDILELLIDYKANVNIANKRKYTPLAYAIVYNDVKAAQMLLDAGADPNQQVNTGVSMADFARPKGNDSIVDMLKAAGAISSSKPDFSEWRFLWTSTFNSHEYMTGLRTSLYDTKYGFYFHTGVDFRPSLIRTQIELDDQLYQFRESRVAWSHGFGKDFQLVKLPEDGKLSLYGEISGLLGFPDYKGSNKDPLMDYKLVPEAGLSYFRKYAGFSMGASWMNYGNLLDSPVKINFRIFFRLNNQETSYDRKEIYWE